MADLSALADQIAGLTLKDAKELSDILKDKYGLEPAAGGAVMMAAAAPAAEAVEQTEFDLILDSAGDQKIKVIKAVREITNLGLKEAKDLVDGAPKPVLEKKSKEECEAAKRKLEEAGAVSTIK